MRKFSNFDYHIIFADYIKVTAALRQRYNKSGEMSCSFSLLVLKVTVSMI